VNGRKYLFFGILVVQVACALFFVANILMSVFGCSPISWQMSELIELGAAIGLLLGVGTGAMFLRATMRRNRRVEDQLRAASGAFAELLQERFTEWGLTPAERDVALFAIKGMSTKESAGMRDSSEGTVKAQTNAIYRKAGVVGRTQLLSLFIDDLMNATPL
jgi:DNA-binding CsgD family transcriptional regulator